MNWGDFKATEKELGLDTVETPGFFDDVTFESVTDTAGSWLDSLGKTFVKYKDLENTIKNPDTKSNTKADVTQREYENITQKTTATPGGFELNSKHLMYGGAALLAFLVLKGGN